MGLVAERWTDDRMDDLKRQVDGLDRRMEQGFHDLRAEIGGLRSDMSDQIGGLRGEMNVRFDRLETRFDKLVYALVGLSVSIFAAMMGLIAAVILSL
jgi:hypothetical protein